MQDVAKDCFHCGALSENPIPIAVPRLGQPFTEMRFACEECAECESACD